MPKPDPKFTRPGKGCDRASREADPNYVDRPAGLRAPDELEEALAWRLPPGVKRKKCRPVEPPKEEMPRKIDIVIDDEGNKTAMEY